MLVDQGPAAHTDPSSRRIARRFDRAGYDVVVLRTSPGRPRRRDRADWIPSAGVRFLPPRRSSVIGRLNVSHAERRLRVVAGDPAEAVVWLRHPAPELVAALPRCRPALLVYEPPDPHDLPAGLVGRRLDAAERTLATLADLVVAPGKGPAERFRAMGATTAVAVPGILLGRWRELRARRPDPVIGYVGPLDDRIDADLVRAVAESRPHWRIRLMGQVGRGFVTGLADQPNVSVEPPVLDHQVADIAVTFDAGLLPFRTDLPPRHDAAPLALALLATGAPVVATPDRTLAALGGHVRLADTAAEVVAQLDRVLAEDHAWRARLRRHHAEPFALDRRLDELVALVSRTLAPAGAVVPRGRTRPSAADLPLRG